MQKESYIPQRFWWFKRIACAGAAYVLFLIGLRIWWGWEADRRFQAAVERRRAVGEPVLLEDFVRPAIPDEENAAYFLNRATKALKLPAGFRDVGGIQAAIDAQPDSRAATLSQLVGMNKETLRLIAVARTRRASDWKLNLRPPLTSVLLPHVGPVRELGRLEALVTVARHEAGDDAGALEAVEDTLGISAAVADGFLVSHLVSIGIDALNYEKLERITPTLKVRDKAVGVSRTGGAATRGQVELLISHLLGEAECRRTMVRSMHFERMSQIEDAQTFLGGRWGLFGATPILGTLYPHVLLLRPAWMLDTLGMFEWTSGMADAAGMANWPSAAARMPPEVVRTSGPEKTAHVLSSILLPSLKGAVRLSFRTLAMRRMAATALAVRLYEVDHGRRPARLDDLVPEYLPAVPRDLYATDDRPIGYAPNATPPVLYCIDLDGVDDGGKFTFKPTGAMDMYAADLVFFLNGDRPRVRVGGAASQPSTVLTGVASLLTEVASQPASKPTGPAQLPASTQAMPEDGLEDAEGDGGGGS